MVKKIVFVSYGLYLSAVIGIIAAIFLVLENGLTNIIWSNNNHLIQVILVVIGSVILYYMLKRWPNLPNMPHDSLTELKENDTIDYQDVLLNLLVTQVILCFGAGVGPEAALLSAIISLSIWQADNLRYLYFQYDEIRKLPFSSRLQRLFNPLKYRQRYDAQKAPQIPAIVRQKKLLYVVFTINGILAFALLIRQTDQPSFILKLGQSNWQLADLWMLPILIIVGMVFGIICKLCYRVIYKWSQRFKSTLMTRIILGAIGIIIVSYLAPDLLFSGQHSLHLLLGAWVHKSPLFLTIMAVLKLIFLVWCLNLNWRGGDIFPITFAAMIEGFAIASLLPKFDTLFVVAIVATTIMSELSSPILAGIFIILFFPIKLTPIILLVAILFFLRNKYLPKLNIKTK